MANKKFKNNDTLDSSCVLYNENKLNDVLNNKASEEIFRAFMTTGGTYSTTNNKKFSDYKFLEASIYSGTGAYSNVILGSTFCDGTTQQITKYEKADTTYATPLIIFFQYASDTSVKCIRCGYISQGNYNDNPYTLIIKGIN